MCVGTGMRILRGSTTAAAVFLLLFAGGCAGRTISGAAGPGPSTSPSGGVQNPGSAPVLRVERYGGLMAPGANLMAFPVVSVYADGRVVTQGPVPAIYPGAALPNLQMQQISPDAVRTLVEKSVAAGVRTGATFGRPQVADAPTTRITVIDGGRPQTVEVAALNETSPGDSALTPAQKADRAKLATLVQQLTNLPGTLGPAQVGPAAPYTPTAIAALATPWNPGTQSGPNAGVEAPKAQDWPGPALPGEKINAAGTVGCVIVTGAKLPAVLEAAKTAKTITPWTSGARQWTVMFRVLLPDEADCATLKKRA